MDVTIVDRERTRSEDVTVPGDVAVHRLVGKLVQLLGQPATGPDGRPLAYRLQHVRSASEIDDHETLAAAGVVDDDVLELTAVPSPAGHRAPPPPPPPPPPPRAPERPSPAGSRRVLVAVAAGLLLVAGGVVAYLLVSSDDDEPARRVPAVSAPRVTALTTAPTETAPQESNEDREAAVARRIQRIVAFSLAGRTDVREGRYDDAVANRRTVLRRLDAITGVTGRAAAARRTLRRAMQASLEADIAYRDGEDTSASDAEATCLKGVFVRQWTSIAEAHGLRVYREGDF
jgi:hypothetical protein